MSIQDLFSEGLLQVAKQPKNNQLDLSNIGDVKVLFFPIDHDYPGGSAAMTVTNYLTEVVSLSVILKTSVLFSQL
jgi:hypothetical protein